MVHCTGLTLFSNFRITIDERSLKISSRWWQTGNWFILHLFCVQSRLSLLLDPSRPRMNLMIILNQMNLLNSSNNRIISVSTRVELVMKEAPWSLLEVMALMETIFLSESPIHPSFMMEILVSTFVLLFLIFKTR